MSDELNFDVAVQMAQGLTTIPEFPRFAGAIRETAQDLVRWCTGAIINRKLYSAEAQAAVVITEAREKWTTWQGTAALYKIFSEKFVDTQLHVPRAGLSYEETLARGLIRPPCERCDDTGYTGKPPNVEFCICRQGRHQKNWEGERGLQRINTPPESKPIRTFASLTYEQMKQALEDEERRKADQLRRLGLD